MSVKKIRVKDESISINLNTATSAGGQTGSVRVQDEEGNYYQYKPPIAENSFKRKIKSSFLDKENFGEVLASRIALAFDKDKNNPRVPTVSFVTDPHSPYVAISSKYLKGGEGATVQSLDDYLGKPEKKSHIKLIAGESNPAQGLHSIDQNPTLKRELAEAIALSALVGDHDVNPGNMIVIKETNGDIRLGRIDYGHAFNDLMRFSKFGGKQIHDNNIIDFFNRETVDGIGYQSKLWRDYPGLIPSKEMADALKNLAGQSDAAAAIQVALNSVKAELKIILAEPGINQEQVIRSFQQIAEHVTGQKIVPKLADEGPIDAIFNGLEKFCKKNLQQMAYAAEIMDLQVGIRDAIKNGKTGELEKFKDKYEELVQQGKILGPFSWIKEAAKSPPFKGNFDSFVKHLQNEKKLNQLAVEIDKFLKGSPSPSAYEEKECQKLQVIITNPKKSVEDKFSLLRKMVEIINVDPQPKTSVFKKVLNALSHLIKSKSISLEQQATGPGSEEPQKAVTQFTSFKKRMQDVIQPLAEAEQQKTAEKEGPTRKM